MPSTRSRRPLNLRVTRPGVRVVQPRTPAAAWWIVGLAGAGIAAAAGWLLVAGLVVLGWISAIHASLLDALRVGVQAWLLAHGAGGTIGPLRLTLTPLLLTGILWLLVHTAASFAARAYSSAQGEEGVPTWRRAGAVGRIAGLVAGAYTLVVAAAAVVVAPPEQAMRALLMSALVSGTAALVGAASTLHWRPWRLWPAWARIVPRAVLASVATALAGGGLAVLAGLVVHRDRVAAIATALHAPALGNVVLVIAQLLWLPTYILWGTAWTLGGGVSVGTGTVVSLGNTHVGNLPGIPILGILPANGPGGGASLLWLVVGVAAGAVAGLLVVRSRPRARADETALVGGLSGVLAALAVVVLCALARGDLGTARLVGLGPRLPELLLLATALMGLSGTAAGLVLGLVRKPVPSGFVAAGEPDQDDADDDEEDDESR